MIDASTFSSQFNSFWNELAPTTEHFVRRVNLSEMERDFPPMEDSKKENSAFLAEYAFSLFSEQTKQLSTQNTLSSKEVSNKAYVDTISRLSPYQHQGVVIPKILNEGQINETKLLSNRLGLFFNLSNFNVKVRPIFDGCGYVLLSLIHI